MTRGMLLCALLFALCAGTHGLAFSYKSDPSVIIPSHHHRQFDSLKALSPLDLSSNERALWLQAAFAEKLHQDQKPHIDKCIICEVVVQLIQWAVNSNLTESVMEDIATMYCEYKEIYGGFPDVCYGMIKEDGPILVYVLSKKYLDPKTVCTELKLCNSTKTIAVPQGWDGESVLNLQPETPSCPSKPRNVGTFAHLSDIHFDFMYTVGTDADCGKPECCRVENGYPSDPSAMAGPFGDLRNCDTSPGLLESTVAFIQSLPAVDFVVWTGDEPPHDVWEQSRAENLNASALVTDAMLRAFGSSPVFPSIGNHESFPVNQFEGPGADNWLYDTLAQDWSVWLDQQAQNSLRYGGYYAALLPGTKLRVISVNSNYGNSGNFWLLIESGDVAGQLQFINSTLAACRANGERAYIIGHIPWGSTVNDYAVQVHAIIEQYQDVIAGQFFGHTHHDQFQVFRDNATNSIPISISFIAPSVTPYGYVLPSFRVYQYDRDTFEVIDYASYTLNITEANIAGNASWYVEYTLKSEYGMAGATASDFQQLITRMNTDDSLFYKYRYHFSRLPPGSCDDSCKKEMLCTCASSTHTLYRQCMSTADSVIPELEARPSAEPEATHIPIAVA